MVTSLSFVFFELCSLYPSLLSFNSHYSVPFQDHYLWKVYRQEPFSALLAPYSHYRHKVGFIFSIREIVNVKYCSGESPARDFLL